MRKAVHVEQSALNNKLRQTTEDLKHLNHVRNLARSITQNKVDSIDGQPEVRDALRLEDYPNAPAETAAKLLGIERDYFQYQNALIGLKHLDRFELNEDGNAVLKETYIQEVEEEFTQFFDGQLLKYYNALDLVCKEVKRANKVLGVQAIKLLSIDYEGNPTPIIPAIMELVPRPVNNRK